MDSIIALLCVFGCPVAIVGLIAHYRYKAKQLAAGHAASDQKLLAARCEELEQRIQTLETIVCEGDLDAAAKMRAVAAPNAKNEVKQLPAPKPDPAP